MVGYLFGAGTKETPESLRRKRELIAEMMMGERTPQNWGEGWGAIMKGIASGMESRQLDKAETEGRASATSMMDKIKGLITGTNPDIFGGQASAGNIPMSGAGSELASTTPGGGSTYRDAIASIESAGSGDYAAVGPRHPKMGRALGRYQIMESNIGPWSREALGREVTPDEFMADPKLQDAIFDKKFGSYVERFGPEGAARAWFGGPGGVGKTNRKDVLGTSIGGYGQKFMKALGAGGGDQVAAATPDAAFGAVMPELGGGQSLSDEVAAYQQTPEYQQQFPGQQQQGFDAGRFGEPMQMQQAQAGQALAMNQQQSQNLPMQNQTQQGQQALANQPQQVAQAQTGQQQSMSGPSLQQLYEAAANPWLSPEQKSVVNMLLEQEMRKQQAAQEESQWRGRQDYEQQLRQRDPSYQLEQDYRRAQIEKMQREASAGGTPELGLNPQYGVDKDGNPVLIQIGKDGKAVQTAMPDGISLSKEPIKLDAGTHFVLLDPITRQPVGTIPKENRAAARETAIGSTEGKTQAEQQAAAPGDYQAAENALDLLGSIRNDPYRERGTGASSLLNAIPGTGGYDFAQKVEQAKSGAFLTAIQQMKGLGALSNTEGQAATAAITRMNTAMTEDGFLSALDDYEKIVNQALDRAAGRLPGGKQERTSSRRSTNIGGYTIEEVD